MAYICQQQLLSVCESILCKKKVKNSKKVFNYTTDNLAKKSSFSFKIKTG